MKNRTLCSLLLALAVAAPAAATGAPGAPHLRHSKADTSLATSTLLNKSTLGSGWVVASHSTSGQVVCDNAATPNESDLTETGGASGPLFTRPEQAIAQSTHVFATSAQAATAWARMMPPKLVICMEQEVENLSAMSAPVYVTAWYRLRFAPLATRVAGYRVVARATTTKKTKETVYLDVLLLGHDRTMTTLILSALKAPFSNGFEQGLARTLAAQLNKG